MERMQHRAFASRSFYELRPRPGLHQKKVALAAFFPLPVGLAFLVSLTTILAMITFRPATRLDASSDALASIATIKTSQSSATISHAASKPLPSISPVFTKEVTYWGDAIAEWSDQYELDPNLIAILMQIESCGHPSASSSAGAMGLFQVMPYHFEATEDPYDPNTNAQRGLSYFARALQLAGGDPALAFAGYNGGHGVINMQPQDWSSETRRYVYWGTGILADIKQGNATSARLEEWLSAGGASLCSLAANALSIKE
jgi:soluble lytic murein transglycosylase-like protein